MHIFFEGQVIWSQIDANQHMRHSAYADFAAQARVNMLEKVGLTASKLFELKIGPVLFREELSYLREVALNDYIKVTCEIVKSRADAFRWTTRHEIYRSDGVKAAVIVAEGAWIDTVKRRLVVLPEEMSALFLSLPRSEDFVEETAK
ncbi:thioesterase family protein [uncultured Mucilaginibacter sp.]|uniref:acyl-CoA thioesterase n=1 Tax=uncultured Mucilaginibacter sp. TaxID=797541 RepID=UPI00260B8F88|nr:thioesterase family protein [uncultured Mucilaginibacter sp.]